LETLSNASSRVSLINFKKSIKKLNTKIYTKKNYGLLRLLYSKFIFPKTTIDFINGQDSVNPFIKINNNLNTIFKKSIKIKNITANKNLIIKKINNKKQYKKKMLKQYLKNNKEMTNFIIPKNNLPTKTKYIIQKKLKNLIINTLMTSKHILDINKNIIEETKNIKTNIQILKLNK
jgi:hypothetical protein